MCLIKLHHMLDLHVYIKRDHRKILLTPTNLQTRLRPKHNLKFYLQFHLPSRNIKLHWFDYYIADQITLLSKFEKAVIFSVLSLRNQKLFLKRYSLLCLVNLSNFLNRHLTARPAHTLLLTGLMGRHYESENRSTPSLITHTSPP